MGTIRPFLAAMLFSICFLPLTALAAGLSVSPSVIDLEGKPRDIMKGEVRIKNTSPSKLVLFPDVRDYAKDPGQGSMISWVELTRGTIELDPGEERAVPYLIHVIYNAKPGHYHGILWFGVGSFRSEAENHPERVVEVLVNVKVLDDAIERLQLGTFSPDQQIFSSEQAAFSFGVQNTGNRILAPGGEIRIYDRRGREIATVPVNKNGSIIEPSGKELLAASWGAKGAFGRYKAVLNLEYANGDRTLTDTTFFWVLPLGKTLSLFTGMSVVIILITMLLHARAQAKRMRFVESVITTVGGRESEERGKEFFEKMEQKKHAKGTGSRFEDRGPFQEQDNHLSPTTLSVKERISSPPQRESATRLSAKVVQSPQPEHVLNLSRKLL